MPELLIPVDSLRRLTRECGDCTACCMVGEIPELDKPSFTLCQFAEADKCGSCTIYPDRPQRCKDFYCMWIQGFGGDEDRPKDNGVMFFYSEEPDKFIYAIELEEGAARGSAKDMLVDMARVVALPIIVSSFGRRPPDDSGDFVVLREQLMPRASQIAGGLVEQLSEDVGMYVVLKGGVE